LWSGCLFGGLKNCGKNNKIMQFSCQFIWTCEIIALMAPLKEIITSQSHGIHCAEHQTQHLTKGLKDPEKKANAQI
jgi:hypothetical protein